MKPPLELLSKEARKTCKICGFSPDEYTEHFMSHRPAKWSYGKRLQSQAMVYKCYRCKYKWEISLEARW